MVVGFRSFKVGVPSWIEYTKKTAFFFVRRLLETPRVDFIKNLTSVRIRWFTTTLKNILMKNSIWVPRYIEKCFEDSPKIDQFLDQTLIPSKIIGNLEHIYWITVIMSSECIKTVTDRPFANHFRALLKSFEINFDEFWDFRESHDPTRHSYFKLFLGFSDRKSIHWCTTMQA